MSETFPHGRAGFKKLGCHCDDCEFRRHQPGYVDKGCRCRVCKDGQNEYVTAQRNRRKNGGRKSARTRGRSVTRSEVRPGATQSPAERPQRDQAASTPASPHGRAVSATDPGKGQGESPARVGDAVAPPVAPERSPQTPASAPESPAKRARPTGGSKAPRWKVPPLWTDSTEPKYGEEHRVYLADALTYIAQSPTVNFRYAGFDRDTPKQEVKDFARLVKAFRKDNPGILDSNGDANNMRGFTYYGYYLTSPEYVGESESESETETDDAEVSTAVKPDTDTVTPAITRAQKPSVTFRRPTREGTCMIHVSEQAPCSNAADGTYTMSGNAVCESHFTAMKVHYPTRVKYVAPNSTPFKPANATANEPPITFG